MKKLGANYGFQKAVDGTEFALCSECGENMPKEVLYLHCKRQHPQARLCPQCGVEVAGTGEVLWICS